MRSPFLTFLAATILMTAMSSEAIAKQRQSRRRPMVASYNPQDLKQYPRTVSKSVAIFDASTGQILWQMNGKCSLVRRLLALREAGVFNILNIC